MGSSASVLCVKVKCHGITVWFQADSGMNLSSGICSRDRYITHFFCLVVEASLYNNMIECLSLVYYVSHNVQKNLSCLRWESNVGSWDFSAHCDNKVLLKMSSVEKFEGID